MKKYLFAFLITALLFVLSTSVHATIRVFACGPEWESLTREIAGDRVEIFTATTAFQDPHTIAARPGLIAQMRRADLVIGAGAELEIGWLPLLLQRSGNRSIQMGAENNIMAANHVTLLEVPATIDRSMGDIHAEGNPHVHLNPHNLFPISDAILARLVVLDPANADYFTQRHRAFTARLRNQITIWERQAQPLRGMNVIPNHRNLSYFYDWLGINAIAYLEPRPGVPPTTRHLATLVDVARNNNVRLIEFVPFESPRGARWLSQRTDIPAIEVPFNVGAQGTTDLFELFDRTIEIFLAQI
ncbi:MAG: zinc ABC transporter substrate-binding protein [Elusimicrobia bacterium]|nr:zinc ABC transporter substrate-binding protein [Elusimicrobiota bacterium]